MAETFSVKICGLVRREDALLADAAGADFLGVVVSPGFRRSVDAAATRGILEGTRAQKVAVVVDLPVLAAAAAARQADVDVIQLHGEEEPAVLAALGQEGPWALWKAVRAGSLGDLERAVERYADVADALLVEGWKEGVLGGGGARLSLDPGRVRALIPSGLGFVLAGGLEPGTVGAAVRSFRPDVVDVSSGVERAVGAKDAGLVLEFVREARAAAEWIGAPPDLAGDRRPRAIADPPQGRTMTVRAAQARQRFGKYGGRYVPETLMHALDELAEAYDAAREDPTFQAELATLLGDFAGRPTPLYRARRLGEAAGHPAVYLKREDLAHTGAHKINNTLGQALLTRRMGKRRVIAETGAGQHGVATATACALFDLECVVYMGEEDVGRQALNVYRMELLGAEVRPVASGTRTLKDATNEAIRDWVTNVETTHYIIGSVVGPDPFPRMVRDFQAVIGREVRSQMLDVEGRLPAAVVACVGGGSNAIGIFHAFVPDQEVQLIGVEAGGRGLESGHHSASLAKGTPGVLHGALSYLLQDSDGQVAPAHSVSAGLDYPGVGPEHSFLKDSQRARYTHATDDEALAAFHRLAELEGIIPALESAHAVAHILRHGRDYDGPVVVCLSGRGDKDVAHVARLEGRGSLL